MVFESRFLVARDECGNAAADVPYDECYQECGAQARAKGLTSALATNKEHHDVIW
jgi:hypothetical protein